MNIMNDKLPLIDVSNPIWLLERGNWKSSSTPSSGLLLIIIFEYSLFECITRSSLLSLEEIKLIAIVSCIFHELEFLRLFMMSFKYGLVLLRYSSNDSVLFLWPLLSYSVWLPTLKEI